MKKFILPLFSLILLASCGESGPSYCDCMKQRESTDECAEIIANASQEERAECMKETMQDAQKELDAAMDAAMKEAQEAYDDAGW